jgi:DNA polymerase (family 10)
LQNPFVDILAHPTGRLLLRRAAYSVDMHAVIDCAAENGVAIEINANPNRLDVDWRLGPYMKAAGVKTVIAPDAHRVDQLDNAKYGVNIARKAWFEKNDVLNCLSATALLKHVEKMRRQRR